MHRKIFVDGFNSYRLVKLFIFHNARYFFLLQCRKIRCQQYTRSASVCKFDRVICVDIRCEVRINQVRALWSRGDGVRSSILFDAVKLFLRQEVEANFRFSRARHHGSVGSKKIFEIGRTNIVENEELVTNENCAAILPNHECLWHRAFEKEGASKKSCPRILPIPVIFAGKLSIICIEFV